MYGGLEKHNEKEKKIATQLNYLVSWVIDNKLIWNLDTYRTKLSLKGDEGMRWTIPLTKDKRTEDKRTEDILEALVKWENWEDSLVIWQKALEFITQGKENWPRVRRACVFKCAKVVVGAPMLDYIETCEDCFTSLL